jgi:hypothetical protein
MQENTGAIKQKKLKNKLKAYSDRFKALAEDITSTRTQEFGTERTLTDSKVLKMKGGIIEKDIDYIIESLKRPKKIELIFRASEH